MNGGNMRILGPNAQFLNIKNWLSHMNTQHCPSRSKTRKMFMLLRKRHSLSAPSLVAICEWSRISTRNPILLLHCAFVHSLIRIVVVARYSSYTVDDEDDRVSCIVMVDDEELLLVQRVSDEEWIWLLSSSNSYLVNDEEFAIFVLPLLKFW